MGDGQTFGISSAAHAAVAEHAAADTTQAGAPPAPPAPPVAAPPVPPSGPGPGQPAMAKASAVESATAIR